MNAYFDKKISINIFLTRKLINKLVFIIYYYIAVPPVVVRSENLFIL